MLSCYINTKYLHMKMALPSECLLDDDITVLFCQDNLLLSWLSPPTLLRGTEPGARRKSSGRASTDESCMTKQVRHIGQWATFMLSSYLLFGEAFIQDNTHSFWNNKLSQFIICKNFEMSLTGSNFLVFKCT